MTVQSSVCPSVSEFYAVAWYDSVVASLEYKQLPAVTSHLDQLELMVFFQFQRKNRLFFFTFYFMLVHPVCLLMALGLFSFCLRVFSGIGG